ncbi:DMT family transporter [Halobellus captivus]|uniref:DMT family transporter n=1 Tax=Halobellus captivus TaxID=2592614 RepID=UPI0011A4F74E|nr:EamA family transporter [Halobellus captivus]
MRYRTALVFLCVAAVWGTAFMVTKVGLEWLPPALFAALRFDLAAVLLFGLAVWRGDRLRPVDGREWRPIATGGVLLIGVHHALLFAGQQHVTSAVAAVLLGLIPIITPALTRLSATRERLGPIGVLGVGLGFLGVITIANPDPSNLVGSDLRGIGLVLGSALAFAVGAVLTHDSQATMPFVTEQAWMMLVGAVVLHTTSALLPGESLAQVVWTGEAMLSLVYLAVVAGAGGFALYFWLLRRVGPVEVSLLEYVIPIFAAVSGWIALQESLAPRTVLGFAIIFTGFVLVKRRTIRAELRQWHEGPEPQAQRAD